MQNSECYHWINHLAFSALILLPCAHNVTPLRVSYFLCMYLKNAKQFPSIPVYAHIKPYTDHSFLYREVGNKYFFHTLLMNLMICSGIKVPESQWRAMVGMESMAFILSYLHISCQNKQAIFTTVITLSQTGVTTVQSLFHLTVNFLQ